VCVCGYDMIEVPQMSTKEYATYDKLGTLYISSVGTLIK
jgi:hypothetical protein